MNNTPIGVFGIGETSLTEASLLVSNLGPASKAFQGLVTFLKGGGGGGYDEWKVWEWICGVWTTT